MLIAQLQSLAPYLCWCAEQARVQQPSQFPVPASLDGQQFRWTGPLLLDSVLQVNKERLKGQRDIGDKRCLPEPDSQCLSVWLLLWQLESLGNALADGMWEHLRSRCQGLTLPNMSSGPEQVTLPLWASQPFSNENKITYLAGLLWILSEVIHVPVLY